MHTNVSHRSRELLLLSKKARIAGSYEDVHFYLIKHE
jgi:hypothetical protein